MRILVEIQHPAHAHQFRYFISEMEKRGNKVHIITTDKEVTLPLLDSFGYEYSIIGTNVGGGALKKIKLLINCCYITYKISRSFKPDIYISRESLVSGVISRIFRKPHICFSDTDHVVLVSKITTMLNDIIITPSSYRRDLGKKQLYIEGYKELMYLHPNYFKPNPNVLNELGVSENEKLILLRFVSWQAYHDVGHHGIENRIEFIRKLQEYGRVFISSESPLDPELECYNLNISPEKLHDVLNYTSLYIGEGGTTAVEAAVLGTPAIFISSLSGTMGNFTELEEKYGLLYSFKDEGDALAKANELLQRSNLKDEWDLKRNKMLEDKIDVTAFMTWFVEKYPDSFRMVKEGPDFQKRFKK